MLNGCDLSHWNNDNVITSNFDFVICKASEGTTYKDKTFNSKLDKCKELNIGLVGAYHYAKTNQNVEDNVNNFLNAISHRKEFKNTMILALDIEGDDIKRGNAWEWCLSWCRMVFNKTGIKPLIYTSASYTKYMQELFNNDFGLWVAHWNVTKPKINVYPFYAIWQHTNTPFDLDVFNGTKEQYIKYCQPKEREV